jgi:hypothetical protein
VVSEYYSIHIEEFIIKISIGPETVQKCKRTSTKSVLFQKKISLKASEGEFFHVVGLYIELGLDSLCENSE